jgi:hypothetical protein
MAGSRTKVLFSSLIVGLCIVFGARYTMLNLRIAFGDGQVAIFKEMEASAKSTADPLSGKLEYVLNYYPSGSKQARGTQLDTVVESARSNAIAALITRLRVTTGKDFGNDPGKWLKEYSPNPN